MLSPNTGLSPAQERIEYLLWLTRTGGGAEGIFTQFNPEFSFTDSGFDKQFQDSSLWPFSGNQVGHFLTAVGMSYDPQVILEVLTIGHRECIIGHKLMGDGIGGLAQCTVTTSKDIDLFEKAIMADLQADYCTRDQIIRTIMPGIPEDRAIPGRNGNSQQDFRLSLKGVIYGRLILNNEITTLPHMRQWLINNLRPKSVEGPF